MDEGVKSNIDKLINSQIADEVKYAKEYGDEYFNSGTGFLTGRFARAIGDSGQGRRVFDIIRKINNDNGDLYTNEELTSKINLGYKNAGLSYKFKLPEKFETKKIREQKQEGGKLIGNQTKLDANKDGEITASDFEALRERTQKQMGGMMEGQPLPTEEEQMQSLMGEKTYSEEMQEELEPLPEKPEMNSDEEMEDGYLDFIINEALSDEEEAMLMNELQNNPQLSMLFDKVMDVAIEFSGSGPVEGPGSEVSDSIPARLSDGEFVFTAKAVDVIGADNLMSMMKQAEAKADERQPAQEGGLMEEDEYTMPVEEKPTEQVIRVTKETVGSQATMQEEDDLVGDELKKSMLSNRPYVRS